MDAQRKGKAVVLKTTTRQTIFLPVIGLVDGDKLKPADLVGVNKDSYLILDTLPAGRGTSMHTRSRLFDHSVPGTRFAYKPPRACIELCTVVDFRAPNPRTQNSCDLTNREKHKPNSK